MLTTERLALRQWQTSDLPVFAELNADPEVMEYFPKCLTKKESDALADRCQNYIASRGWSFWAVEEKSSEVFIGFVGLHNPPDMPFSPCIEIGWRLHKKFWGKGYATEAAHESLAYAFETLNTDEVVSFTTLSNQRSRAVMERLGFQNSGQNFFHPSIDRNHPLSEHVLYRLKKSEWLTKNNE